MLVRILIDRETAILAGRNDFGAVSVELNPADLDAAERRELAATPLNRQGVADLFDPPEWRYNGAQVCDSVNIDRPNLPHADDPTEAARAFLAWRIAVRQKQTELNAARAAEQDEANKRAATQADLYVEHARQQPAEAFIELDGINAGLPGICRLELPQGWPEFPNRLTGASDECLRDIRRDATEKLASKLGEARELAKARRQEAHERRLKEAAAAEELAAARKQQIEEWVRANGTANQQGRLELGLLPQSEVLDEIRGWAFRHLDEFPRYRKIRASDIAHADDCYDESDIDCAVVNASAMSSEAFEKYRAIRRALPEGAKIQARSHSCVCESCGKGLARMSARVEIVVGHFTFSREYALDWADGDEDAPLIA